MQIDRAKDLLYHRTIVRDDDATISSIMRPIVSYLGQSLKTSVHNPSPIPLSGVVNAYYRLIFSDEKVTPFLRNTLYVCGMNKNDISVLHQRKFASTESRPLSASSFEPLCIFRMRPCINGLSKSIQCFEKYSALYCEICILIFKDFIKNTFFVIHNLNMFKLLKQCNDNLDSRDVKKKFYE